MLSAGFAGFGLANNSDCKREYRSCVIDQLCADGLLDRIGRTPERSATITETGLMTLDILGGGQ